jgi:hypothetical protein
MHERIETAGSVLLAAVIAAIIWCSAPLAEPASASGSAPFLDEPFGTICTNEYVYERIDALGGYVEMWSRTYMAGGLRMFETTISNNLGAAHPIHWVYLFGYGIDTNHTEALTWQHWYYPQWLILDNALISNECGERITYAAEDNLQQEVWKIFTNDIRSMVVTRLPDSILGTNVHITTLGPTNEPEPGMICILPAGIFLLVRYLKRK